MEEEIIKKIESQNEKLDAVFNSIEKLKKYFLIIVWVTIIAVALPMIGLVFAIPSFLNIYSSLSGF